MTSCKGPSQCTLKAGVGVDCAGVDTWLTHDVLVMQAAPRGPPLHSRTVVEEVQFSTGGGVNVGAVEFDGEFAKSGGIPVGLGTQ